ncbi:unnamed protein product, partial [Hapterophycus canaliculatus]
RGQDGFARQASPIRAFDGGGGGSGGRGEESSISGSTNGGFAGSRSPQQHRQRQHERFRRCVSKGTSSSSSSSSFSSYAAPRAWQQQQQQQQQQPRGRTAATTTTTTMMATAGAESEDVGIGNPRDLAEKAVAAAAGAAADAAAATVAVAAAASDVAAGGGPTPGLGTSEFVSKEHRRAGPFKAVLLYLDYVRWLWNVTDKERLDREQPEGMVSERVKTVVSGIEDLRREAGVSLRESSVRPEFEELVSASDALKKALASAKINP